MPIMPNAFDSDKLQGKTLAEIMVDVVNTTVNNATNFNGTSYDDFIIDINNKLKLKEFLYFDEMTVVDSSNGGTNDPNYYYLDIGHLEYKIENNTLSLDNYFGSLNIEVAGSSENQTKNDLVQFSLFLKPGINQDVVNGSLYKYNDESEIFLGFKNIPENIGGNDYNKYHVFIKVNKNYYSSLSINFKFIDNFFLEDPETLPLYDHTEVKFNGAVWYDDSHANTYLIQSTKNFTPSNYYTKTQVDNLLQQLVDDMTTIINNL